MRTLLTSSLVLSLLAVGAGCAPTRKVVIEPNESAKIYRNDKVLASLEQRWATSFISAVATAPIPPGYQDDPVGRAQARDAALVKARAELYSQLGDVHITEEITVLNATVKSLRVSRMEGTLRASELIDDRWDDSQKVHVISLKMPKTALVKYVKEWIDDGSVNPDSLDAYIKKGSGAP